MSTYDLKNINDLIEFDKDCARASADCQQVSYVPNTISIKAKKDDAISIFKFWRSSGTLWVCGYHVELSIKSKETFEFIEENGLSSIRGLR